MSQTILAYRIYFLDHDNRIAKAHDVTSASDADACALAAKMLEEQSQYPCVEVWDRGRRVWRHP